MLVKIVKIQVDSSMSETAKFTGGCFCHCISYAVEAVFDAGYCHCSICRRFSGAPASVWFNVREQHFSLTSGKPNSFRSSEHFTRYFCASCGTHLFGRDDRPPSPKVGSRLVSVMVGTLDDPE
ncbi:GFA family protein [Myxosarcina sp. GI1(2024)]